MSDKISFVYEIHVQRAPTSPQRPGVPVTPQTCLKDRPAAARRAFVKTVAESAGVWRLIEQKRCILLSWLWHRQRQQQSRDSVPGSQAMASMLQLKGTGSFPQSLKQNLIDAI